jgi:hypothetical protein
MYPGMYQLKVTSYDIRDENEDRVFELGEHLFIKNIVVEDHGKLCTCLRNL